MPTVLPIKQPLNSRHPTTPYNRHFSWSELYANSTWRPQFGGHLSTFSACLSAIAAGVNQLDIWLALLLVVRTSLYLARESSENVAMLCTSSLSSFWRHATLWIAPWHCVSPTPQVLFIWPCKSRSRAGAYSNKLWPYTGNRTKSRGWVLFTSVYAFTIYLGDKSQSFCSSVWRMLIPDRLVRPSPCCNPKVYSSPSLWWGSAPLIILILRPSKHHHSALAVPTWWKA